MLRAFRDEVLVGSSIGKPWAEDYQKHRRELATIIASDQQFRSHVLSSMNSWLPLIAALTYPEEEGAAILTPQHIEAAENVISGLAERGSKQLQVTIDRESWILTELHQHVGEDIRDVWRDLNGKSTK